MMKSNQKHPPQGHQQGIALIVCLLLLLVLTVISVSAMQTTLTEEKMAGNLRDHELAFQSSETALRAGERKLIHLDFDDDSSSSSLGNGDSSNRLERPPNASKNGSHGIWDSGGLDPETSSDNVWWQEKDRNAHWWTDDHPGIFATEQLTGNSRPANYLIEYLGFSKYNGLGVADYEDNSGVDIYRLTTRAEGGSTDTVVYLQSVLAWRYD